MTPEDQTTLRQALSRVNSPRSKYLNRAYTRPVVDAEVKKIKGEA